MKRLALLLTFVFVFGESVVQAQHAGAFARVGFGARGIAMGNAIGADVFGGTSPYYNPAMAPLTGGQHLDASVAALSFDRSLQFLQIGAPLQQRAGFAIGIIHAAVTNIDGRDNSGFHTRDLTVDEYAGFLSFGLRFSNRVSAGINLQMFRTDLFEGLTPARSIGVDIGLAVRLKENWATSIVFDDMLARYTWDSSDIGGSGRNITDSFPRRIRLGVTNRRLDNTLILAAEFESRTTSVDTHGFDTRILGDSPAQVREEINLTLRESRVRFGAEYLPAAGFAIRGGIEQLGADMLDAVRPSLGFMAEKPLGDLLLRAEYTFGYEANAAGQMHLISFRLFL